MTLSNNELALLPKEEIGTDAAVHVVMFYNGYVVLVWNVAKTTKNGFPKPEGWGLPSGEVRSNESPVQAIKREFFEETGGKIEKELFNIFPKPLFVTSPKRKGDRSDFFFIGEISLNKYLPYKERIKVKDPIDMVKSFILVDPFKDILEISEKGKKKFVFGDELIYSRHRTAIARALEADFDELQNHIEVAPKADPSE